MGEKMITYPMQPTSDWECESDLAENYNGPFVPWNELIRMFNIDKLVEHGRRSKIGKCRAFKKRKNCNGEI